MRSPAATTLGFLLCVACAELCAAQQTAAVSGRVTNADNYPLQDVVVHVEGTEAAGLTGVGGRFSIRGLASGDHTLTLSKNGYLAQTYEVTIPNLRVGDVDVGSIVLESSTGPAVTIAGRVIDETTGEPIPRVQIRINGRVVAITTPRGRYRVQTSDLTPGSSYRVDARRIGYKQLEQSFEVPRNQATLEFDLALEPAPVELEGIDVDAERVALTTGRMGGFYRRQGMGMGSFFTRDDIEAMGAQKVTDVVRRVPGARIYQEEMIQRNPRNSRVGFNSFAGRVVVEFQRAGTQSNSSGQICEPLFFVNDMRLSPDNIDELIPTDQIAGMEVYSSPVQVPIEYSAIGSECGVLVFWTDAPVGVGTPENALEVGFHGAVRLRDGRTEAGRLGVHLAIELFGPVEIHPGLSVVLNRENLRRESRWQIFATGKVRPMGRRTPWYVGTGVAFDKFADGAARAAPEAPTGIDPAHVVLTGVSLPFGPVRPFVELQVLDPFSAGLDRAFVFGGFTIRSY